MIELIYGVTVCDEEIEIVRLLDVITKNKKNKVVVQCDQTKCPDNLVKKIKTYDVEVFEVPFNGDFSKFKNELNLTCQILGADYIFQLDADETITDSFTKNINDFLERNDDVDLFYLPRINTVDGITDEHLNKWGWSIDKQNRINYPDYQGRIFKSHLRWENKVHERIVDMKNYLTLPPEDEFSIIHNKTIKKQESQNNSYNSI